MQNVTDTLSNDRKMTAPASVMPTFLIIGAQKSGTTALYHYLKQHPDVFMSPVKEPNFFAFEDRDLQFCDADGRISPITTNSVTDITSYRALFNQWNGEKAVGEASPHYLYLPGTAQRIKRHLPEVKLIAILRNPIDRAYSAYLHARRANREPVTDFYDALLREHERIRTNHGYIYHYTRAGFYHSQLLEYYDVFGRDQIKVIVYDDFEYDSISIVQDICHFINVDTSFIPDVSFRPNKSGLPKSRILHKLYLNIATRRGIYKYVPSYIRPMIPQRIIRYASRRIASYNLYKPVIADNCYDYLYSTFEEEILKLQDLTGHDLSRWLD